jgi:hypothetical protein
MDELPFDPAEAWGAVVVLSAWGWLLLVIVVLVVVAWWSLRSGPRRGGTFGRDW